MHTHSRVVVRLVSGHDLPTLSVLQLLLLSTLSHFIVSFHCYYVYLLVPGVDIYEHKQRRGCVHRPAGHCGTGLQGQVMLFFLKYLVMYMSSTSVMYCDVLDPC